MSGNNNQRVKVADSAKEESWLQNFSEFQRKACVQAALADPDTPVSVLSFMFGVDFRDPQSAAATMRTGQPALDMGSIWFCGGSSPFDALCEPFQDLVRTAGRGELIGSEWTDSIDGMMAQLLLCDQLSRNVFRGTQEAFAYDERSIELSRQLSSNLLAPKDALTALTGEFFVPYFIFVLAGLMHSESLHDHEDLTALLDLADERRPELLEEWFTMAWCGVEHRPTPTSSSVLAGTRTATE